MQKLNIGCGQVIKQNWVNLDHYPFPGVDVIHDLNTPLPFPDNSFEEVSAHQVLEHLPNLIAIMNEIHRVTLPSGTFTAEVPFWSGTWAHGDPTHVRFFDHNSFDPFSNEWPRFKFMGIQGPWKKLSQVYRKDPDIRRNVFLSHAGFGDILCMTVVLQKAP